MPKVPHQRRGSSGGGDDDRNRVYGQRRAVPSHTGAQKKSPNWGRRFTIFTLLLVAAAIGALLWFPGADDQPEPTPSPSSSAT